LERLFLRHYPEEETAVRLPVTKSFVGYIASISRKNSGLCNFLLHFFKKSEVQGLVNGYGQRSDGSYCPIPARTTRDQVKSMARDGEPAATDR
jgi:hypothetical protein